MNPLRDNEVDPERIRYHCTLDYCALDYFITGWLASFLRDIVVSLINLLAGSYGTEGE